jgi:hypothetical protein
VTSPVTSTSSRPRAADPVPSSSAGGHSATA